MMVDLRKCYFKDDLPTAPWRFLLSFISFLVLYSFSKVRISPKVMIAYNGFCLLRHTKTWLAHDIKTHGSESRGQEEAGRTRQTSELFTRSTAVKFVGTLNKPPLKLSLSYLGLSTL